MTDVGPGVVGERKVADRNDVAEWALLAREPRRDPETYDTTQLTNVNLHQINHKFNLTLNIATQSICGFKFFMFPNFTNSRTDICINFNCKELPKTCYKNVI